jgi:hypothetical protein
MKHPPRNIAVLPSNRPPFAASHETDAPSPRRESPSRRLPTPATPPANHHPSPATRRPKHAPPDRNRRPSHNRPVDPDADPKTACTAALDAPGTPAQSRNAAGRGREARRGFAVSRSARAEIDTARGVGRVIFTRGARAIRPIGRDRATRRLARRGAGREERGVAPRGRAFGAVQMGAGMGSVVHGLSFVFLWANVYCAF